MNFENLEEFTKYWLNNRTFLPPLDAVSQVSNSIYGIVLYRSSPYQVQLFIFPPNMIIPSHRHENVDSYEHYVSGQVYFHKNGKELLPREDFYQDDKGVAAPLGATGKSCITRVFPEDWHGAEIGPLGGSFLSIQKWLNGSPGRVELDWIGQPIDDEHIHYINGGK